MSPCQAWPFIRTGRVGLLALLWSLLEVRWVAGESSCTSEAPIIGEQAAELEDDAEAGEVQVSLLQQRIGLHRTSPKFPLPSMFISVFSRRSGLERRGLIREMYSNARRGPGGFVYKFAICRDNDGLQEVLANESEHYGDLIFLDCDEGYANGLLTLKTLASMRAFIEVYNDRDLFMKVDDDTFISWRRLDSNFETEGWNNTYAGVLYPNCSPVEKNPESSFYEPAENWDKDTFPASMAGGPGYILHATLVKKIFDAGLPEAYPLWNEDKAVGVWVDQLRQDGVPVAYVNITGTDGYMHPDKPYVCGGLWGEYPFTLHHDLSGEAIVCLSKADGIDDPARNITSCFQLNDEDCNPETDTGSSGSFLKTAISYTEKMQIYYDCVAQEEEAQGQLSQVNVQADAATGVYNFPQN